MTVEIPKNEDFSGEGKNVGGEEVNSAIRSKEANRCSINVKKKLRGGVI